MPDPHQEQGVYISFKYLSQEATRQGTKLLPSFFIFREAILAAWLQSFDC